MSVKDKRICILLGVLTFFLVICEITFIDCALAMKSLIIVLSILIPASFFEIYYNTCKRVQHEINNNEELSNKFFDYYLKVSNELRAINVNKDVHYNKIEDIYGNIDSIIEEIKDVCTHSIELSNSSKDNINKLMKVRNSVADISKINTLIFEETKIINSNNLKDLSEIKNIINIANDELSFVEDIEKDYINISDKISKIFLDIAVEVSKQGTSGKVFYDFSISLQKLFGKYNALITNMIKEIRIKKDEIGNINNSMKSLVSGINNIDIKIEELKDKYKVLIELLDNYFVDFKILDENSIKMFNNKGDVLNFINTLTKSSELYKDTTYNLINYVRVEKNNLESIKETIEKISSIVKENKPPQ